MLDTVEPDYLFKLEYDSSSMKVCCWSTLMVSYWGEKIVVPEEVFNRAESLVQVVLHWLVHVHQGCYIIRLFQIDLNSYHYKIVLSCVYNASIQTSLKSYIFPEPVVWKEPPGPRGPLRTPTPAIFQPIVNIASIHICIISALLSLKRDEQSNIVSCSLDACAEGFFQILFQF